MSSTLKPARTFLLKILRMTMPTLLYIALLNPGQLKLISFIADREQPATIGNRESQTYPAQCSGAKFRVEGSEIHQHGDTWGHVLIADGEYVMAWTSRRKRAHGYVFPSSG